MKGLFVNTLIGALFVGGVIIFVSGLVLGPVALAAELDDSRFFFLYLLWVLPILYLVGKEITEST